MITQELTALLNTLQRGCLPGVWSKGVALVRAGAVIPDWQPATGYSQAQSQAQSQDEKVFRVRVADRPVSLKVSLWPEDEDWYCDCQDRNEICAHVAAVVIAIKGGVLLAQCETNGESPSEPTQTTSPRVLPRAPRSNVGQLQYRFTRKDGRLSLDRWLVFINPDRGAGPDRSPIQEQVLTDSLVAYMGGVSSGRIASPPIAVTREDYAVDAALGAAGLTTQSSGARPAGFDRRGELDRESWISLFKGLADCSSIFLDGQPISVSSKPLQISALLLDEGSGFRLKQSEDYMASEIFLNGACILNGVLRGVVVPSLTSEEKKGLAGSGTYFSQSDLKRLVVDILPALQKKMKVEFRCRPLPQVRHAIPRVVLVTERAASKDPVQGLSQEILSVVPTLRYDSSPQSTDADILISDPEVERRWVRKLQTDLQLNLGQRVQFEGEAAVDFVLKVKEQTKDWEITGSGAEAFSLHEPLVPRFKVTEGGAEIGSMGLEFATNFEGRSADPNRVFQAWRENRHYVPLLGGGWASLPKDWLNRYAERLEELIAFKNAKSVGPIPSYWVPTVIELCQELGQPYPDSFKNLQDHLNHIEAIADASLPADLQASLRPYQRQGVNWLCFLRDAQVGAMLADDMGLGKTLQALCSIRGRTLIVCPTSVLSSWSKQIAQFRPQLPTVVYYGNARQLPPASGIESVVLTTYALLRLDRDLLAQSTWDTLVVDEAQVIKNPGSQVAKAVHSLKAGFKLALSGTPLENRLEDLWSQFQLINPGLLGSLESFQERFAEPISRGDRQAAQRLRNKVKPFILRRLKKDVAIDLPPRTEIVLQCELNEEEREIYHALRVSARKEVTEKLESGGSVFAVLELLLRLRQVCCHAALVSPNGIQRSSKVELLIQTLRSSIDAGHRALVFSQWTSYLDLIELELKRFAMSFSRLDGSTRNRETIVEDFQKDSGPSVLLISLKAGGVGLTLTAADHIFIMDPWWNPAVEDQAADRAHRIGQLNPVLIHRLIARDTLEERILELQRSKTALAASVLEDSAAVASMTREDLLNLLK